MAKNSVPIQVPTIKGLKSTFWDNILVGTGSGLSVGILANIFGPVLGQFAGGVLNGAMFKGPAAQITALNPIQDAVALMVMNAGGDL